MPSGKSRHVVHIITENPKPARRAIGIFHHSLPDKCRDAIGQTSEQRPIDVFDTFGNDLELSGHKTLCFVLIRLMH